MGKSKKYLTVGLIGLLFLIIAVAGPTFAFSISDKTVSANALEPTNIGIAPTSIGNAAPWALNFVQVSHAHSHSLGITHDGQLWAWGNNAHGQLGDGTTTNRLAPVRVGNARTVGF